MGLQSRDHSLRAWEIAGGGRCAQLVQVEDQDRKSTRLNSSHGYISYAVFCLKKKNCQHAGDVCGVGRKLVTVLMGDRALIPPAGTSTGSGQHSRSGTGVMRRLSAYHDELTEE